MNFKQAVPREIKGEWVILEKKDGAKFGVKLAPGNDPPPILPSDQPWEKHHMVRWTKTRAVKGRTDAHIAECDWDVPFLKGPTTTIINEEVVPTPEQVPATPIEKIQLEKFELLGMYIAASFLVGNGRDETEGLKVGEVALLLLEDHAKLVEALKSEGFTKENIKKLIRI